MATGNDGRGKGEGQASRPAWRMAGAVVLLPQLGVAVSPMVATVLRIYFLVGVGMQAVALLVVMALARAGLVDDDDNPPKLMAALRTGAWRVARGEVGWWQAAAFGAAVVLLGLLVFGLASIVLAGLAAVAIGGAAAADAVAGSDLASGMIQRIFNLTGSNSEAFSGALGAMLAIFSAACLVVGGAIVVLVILSWPLHMAGKGEVDQKEDWRWYLLRAGITVSLLVPVAAVGAGSGLSGGQILVVSMTDWGSKKATEAWDVFARRVIVGDGQGRSLVGIPAIPGVDGVVHDLFVAEVCRATVNARGVASGTGERVDEEDDANGGLYKRYDRVLPPQGWAAQRVTTGYCGVVRFRAADGAVVGVGAQAMLRAQRRAFFEALPEVRRLAEGFSAAALGGQPVPPPGPVAGVVERYRATLGREVAAAVPAQSAEAVRAVSDMALQGGWASGGALFSLLARFNVSLAGAARMLPDVAAPEVTDAQEVSSVIARAEAWWREAVAVAPTRFPTTALALGSERSWLDWLFSWVSVDSMQRFLIDEVNPIASLAALGSWLTAIGSTTLMTAIAIAGVAHLAVPVGGVVNGAGSGLFGAVANGIMNMVPGAQAIAGMVNASMGYVGLITLTMIICGLALTVVLPLMPMIRMLFAVLTWLLLLLEAVVAFPLMGVALLMPEGGIVTGSAKQGLIMLLGLVVRPFLTVFGLAVSLPLVSIMVGLLNRMMVPAMTAAAGGGGVGVLEFVAYVATYVGVAYGVCNTCFKAIDMMPQAIKWIGGAVNGDSGDAEKAAHQGGNLAKGAQTGLQMLIRGGAMRRR